MRALTAFATLLVVMQTQSRPPISGPVLPGPLGAEPLVVLNAERAWTGADGLSLLLKDDNVPRIVRNAAIRALGRVEDPQQVRGLMALADVSVMGQAGAIAQSLYGFDPALDPGLLHVVADWMRAHADVGASIHDRLMSTAEIASPMSHIQYAQPADVQAIEAVLRKLAVETADNPMPPYPQWYGTAIQGLAALARVNTKTVHYDDKTIAVLTDCVQNISANAGAGARLYAFMALTATQSLDEESERKALAADVADVRRVAMAVLAGPAAGFDDETRVARIRDGLSDTAAPVRYEAIRAWARHAAAANGCQPFLDALKDDDLHVVLEATDVLGDLCADSDDVTNRLEAEATVPPTVGPWQAQTHAFVALSKRSAEKSAILMGAFVTHPVWWVRMYAVAAAAGAKDILRLDKLAYDDNDNVRDAAIIRLRALDPERAAPAILAALDRTDVQLIRTVSGMIKEWPADAKYARPLIASLERLTKEHSMSSRDGRMALLDAIERHAKRDDYTDLTPWLRDFDPVIAERASLAVLHLSGKAMPAQPASPAHMPVQLLNDLRQCVTVDMSNGHSINMKMHPEWAPVAVEQFLKLAIMDRYYNGLTFHRIVPNFVVQGGSPNANEFSGNREYMRDEVAGSNTRGTVGLSTRGRNTGDAQFFVNLVDNPHLDMTYTVFATVQNMDAVDRLQEGDVMRSMTMQSCR